MPVIEPSVGNAPELDDGLYLVECIAIEEKTVENDQFGNRDKLEFSLKLLEVVDKDGSDIVLKPRVNRKWSEKATLFQYATAFGYEADPAEPIDTDVLLHRQARATVHTEKEGDWPRVTGLMALPRGRTTRAKAAETDGPDIDGFWKRIRSAGYERGDVALHLNVSVGALSNKVMGMTQEELDQTVGEMTGLEPDELPFES